MKAEIYSKAVLLELKGLLSSILEDNPIDLSVLRRIDELRRGVVHGDDTAFFSIRAAVSDLDDIPDEARASLFSEKFLNEQRQKSAEYLRDAALDIRAAAKALLSSSWMNHAEATPPTDN
ncbi:hypothetical protein L2Y94_09655 [Luteibacter aegosomatis]|uniref:hypothetical protein n=1 Tax=Luteibacter aegosomatis TaxID=2911537 RepID=UPI001FFB94FD|nr:hypothetical protein [Luteibacter aegosomatis]UPG87594.1 hypothetical protein L2Y94_09655 [Luteibacter aegosomatis]